MQNDDYRLRVIGGWKRQFGYDYDICKYQLWTLQYCCLDIVKISSIIIFMLCNMILQQSHLQIQKINFLQYFRKKLITLMQQNIQTIEAFENIDQCEVNSFNINSNEEKQPHCQNQFYTLHKQKITLQNQKINFSSFKLFKQLSPNTFLIGAKNIYMNSEIINPQSNHHQNHHNRHNQPGRYRAARQIQLNHNQLANIRNNNNNPVVAPNLPVIGIRNQGGIQRFLRRRIGFIQSDEQQNSHLINSSNLILFYLNRDGNIINKMKFAVGSSYKIQYLSERQILLQIEELIYRPHRNKFVSIIKIDVVTKKRLQMFKSRQNQSIKESIYFPQSKLLCIIEEYKEAIIKYIKIKFFPCDSQIPFDDPVYQFWIEIEGYEEKFSFIKGNNNSLVIWFMKELIPFNDYIQFYYRSVNTGTNKRIIIQKPQFMKSKLTCLEYIVYGGENSDKFLLFFDIQQNFCICVYEVNKKTFRRLDLLIDKQKKIKRVQPSVADITRITTQNCIYYLDNLSEKIICEDLLNGQKFLDFEMDYYSQVSYQQDISSFQIINSKIIKNSMFAIVFILEQIIINDYRNKKEQKQNRFQQEKQNVNILNLSKQTVDYEQSIIVDCDLIYEIMALLGSLQK